MIKLPVKTILILYIQNNIQTTKGAECQPDQVDKAEGLVFSQETQAGFKIAFEHVR